MTMIMNALVPIIEVTVIMIFTVIFRLIDRRGKFWDKYSTKAKTN
jgi:hypothetical protein